MAAGLLVAGAAPSGCSSTDDGGGFGFNRPGMSLGLASMSEMRQRLPWRARAAEQSRLEQEAELTQFPPAPSPAVQAAPVSTAPRVPARVVRARPPEVQTVAARKPVRKSSPRAIASRFTGPRLGVRAPFRQTGPGAKEMVCKQVQQAGRVKVVCE